MAKLYGIKASVANDARLIESDDKSVANTNEKEIIHYCLQSVIRDKKGRCTIFFIDPNHEEGASGDYLDEHDEEIDDFYNAIEFLPSATISVQGYATQEAHICGVKYDEDEDKVYYLAIGNEWDLAEWVSEKDFDTTHDWYLATFAVLYNLQSGDDAQ